MNLEAGLAYIYSSYINKKELTIPFLLYSKLSDICNDSFDNVEEVKKYWIVISKINIYECLFEKDIYDSLKYLDEMYSVVSEYISFSDYKLMINYTLNSMNVKCKKKKHRRKSNNLVGFDIKDNVLYKYSGRKSVVVIPDNVKVIKTNAIDSNVYIKKLVIPDNVKKIESFAINNLENLEDLELGNVETIEDFAFWNCKGINNYNCKITNKI